MVYNGRRMGNLLDALAGLALQYPSLSHVILGVGIILQGELAILLAAYLVVNGALTWSGFIGVALGTLVVAELLLYSGGKIFRNTRLGWRWYLKMKPNRRIQHYSYYLSHHLTKLLVAARFLVGANFIILVLAGWSKTRFSQFLRSYFTALLAWFAVMVAIAYPLMSGLSYLRSERIFRRIEIGLAVIVLLFLGAEFLFRKLLKRRIMIEEKAAAIGEAFEEKLGPRAPREEKKTAPPEPQK